MAKPVTGTMSSPSCPSRESALPKSTAKGFHEVQACRLAALKTPKTLKMLINARADGTGTMSSPSCPSREALPKSPAKGFHGGWHPVAAIGTSNLMLRAFASSSGGFITRPVGEAQHSVVAWLVAFIRYRAASAAKAAISFQM